LKDAASCQDGASLVASRQEFLGLPGQVLFPQRAIAAITSKRQQKQRDAAAKTARPRKRKSRRARARTLP